MACEVHKQFLIQRIFRKYKYIKLVDFFDMLKDAKRTSRQMDDFEILRQKCILVETYSQKDGTVSNESDQEVALKLLTELQELLSTKIPHSTSNDQGPMYEKWEIHLLEDKFKGNSERNEDWTEYFILSNNELLSRKTEFEFVSCKKTATNHAKIIQISQNNNQISVDCVTVINPLNFKQGCYLLDKMVLETKKETPGHIEKKCHTQKANKARCEQICLRDLNHNEYIQQLEMSRNRNEPALKLNNDVPSVTTKVHGARERCVVSAKDDVIIGNNKAVHHTREEQNGVMLTQRTRQRNNKKMTQRNIPCKQSVNNNHVIRERMDDFFNNDLKMRFATPAISWPTQHQLLPYITRHLHDKGGKRNK